MFSYGALNRSRGIDPRGITFAAIDMETTGFDPRKGSRVCEIGVVRMRGDGTVLDEYSTLVAPGHPITNEEYHGISDVTVSGAPSFDQIAGDLLARLGDAVIVGHKLDFEEGHLATEFGRLGLRLGGTPGLCTLVFARHQLDQYTYRLADLAALVTGEWAPAQHSALGDARALARLLAAVLTESPQPLYWWGPAPVALPGIPATRLIAPRAAGLRAGSDGWLATLTARLPLMSDPPVPRPEGLSQYRALLGHALADGKIVATEAEQLALVAARAGLTQRTARGVHEQFLIEARARAEADGVVTKDELRELQKAAKSLAASHMISDLEEAAAADRVRANGPLKGWRILPVDSDDTGTVDVVDLAVAQGAKVAGNVTKTVRLVIIPDGGKPADPRVGKANAASIPVVGVAQARRILTNAIEAEPEQGLFDREAGERVIAELAAERAAAHATPEWHRHWRPRELTPAEYRELFVDPWLDED